MNMGNINNVPENTEFLKVTAGFNLDLISSATLRNADRQLPTFRYNLSGPTHCPETSVTNRQSTLRNFPEDFVSRLHRG